MAKRKKKTAGVSRWVILGVLLVGAAAAAAFYASDKFHFGVQPPTQKPTVTVTKGPCPLSRNKRSTSTCRRTAGMVPTSRGYR